jgi:hypothetical protein
VTPSRPQPIDRKDTIMHRRTALSLLSGAAIAPLAGWRDAIAQAAPGRTPTNGQSTRFTLAAALLPVAIAVVVMETSLLAGRAVPCRSARRWASLA